MRLARVVGNLVSTCKTESHEDFKIMIVRSVDQEGNSTGDTMLALDCAQAGVGDYVLVCEEGGGCSMLMDQVKAICNKAIIGVVDYVDLPDKRYWMQ